MTPATADTTVSQTMRQPDKGEVPFYTETGQACPRAVSGRFRALKWWATGLLLAWWHLGPFLRWDRGPGAPTQAILIDMPGRRAYLLGIEIWPQEVYYLTGLLLLAAVGLFLMSALAGRVWCGFLCWQTVYTDLFVAVERLVLGGRSRRLALARAPWSAAKAARWAAVVLAWAALSLACGIGFTLWFGDAPTLLADILGGQAGPYAYLFIAIIGGFCFLLGGFARERVCVYMCPYSRFQSAMFDEHSLIVSYEAWRGEPRAPARKGQDFAGRGHCVDCRMCVVSCPTGIDIRKGNQLACIGCALCVDACNAVMDKFELPRGLISYDSSSNLAARENGGDARFRPLRPRTLVYGGIMAVVGGAMLAALLSRADTEVNVLHERAPLFVELADGRIRNGYVYKVLNKSAEARRYTLRVAEPAGATLDVVGGGVGAAMATLAVPRDDVGTFRIYVTLPAAEGNGRRPLEFILERPEAPPVRTPTLFAGPAR